MSRFWDYREELTEFLASQPSWRGDDYVIMPSAIWWLSEGESEINGRPRRSFTQSTASILCAADRYGRFFDLEYADPNERLEARRERHWLALWFLSKILH
jgi:hypothetical protein